jgi:hypothetical protein
MTAPKTKAARVEHSMRTSSGYSLKGLLLPNAATFDLGDREGDPIARLFGLERNLARPIKITRSKGASRANRYIRKNIGYLHRAAQAGDRKGFGKVLFRIVWYSNAFLLLAIHRTSPRWYKELRFAKLYKGVCELKRIFHWFPVKDQMTSVRSYIPEANGKIRPIDAPTLGWRFASGLMAVFLHVWLDGMGRIPPNQHGALPGRGTGSCWKHIIRNGLLNRRNIYEFDLRSFFSAVRQADVTAVLHEFMKCPDFMTAWFQRVADKHLLKLEDLIADNALKHRPNTEGFVGNLLSTPLRSWPLMLMSIAAGWAQTVYDQERAVQQGPDPGKHTYKVVNSGDPGKLGLPQGWSCSPLLCTAATYPILRVRPDIIMYMDDALVFREDVIDPGNLAACFQAVSGVDISWKKSRFVKRDGVFLRDFTFLGLEYLHASDSFRAKTRKGSTQEFPRAELTEEAIDELELAMGPSPGAKICSDLEGLRSYEFADRYNLLDFFIAFMYNGGVIGRNDDVARLLRAQKGSFLHAYMNRESSASCDLYNASTSAVEAFHRSLKAWGHRNRAGSVTGGKKGWVWGRPQRPWERPAGHALTEARARRPADWRDRPVSTMPCQADTPASASIPGSWPSAIPPARQRRGSGWGRHTVRKD